MDGDPFFFELRFAPQKIFLPAAPPKGVYVGVLQQQQGRRALPLCDLRRVLILQSPCGVVFDQTQIFDDKFQVDTHT
jgi:hypothetical protein